MWLKTQRISTEVREVRTRIGRREDKDNQLHQFYLLRAGSIQIVHGLGEPWSLDDAQYPQPDPEIDPEFGEYILAPQLEVSSTTSLLKLFPAG